MEFIQDLWLEIAEMGVEHNVNPILFAILYFGTIPPYMGSMVWAVRNHKKGKATVIPILSTLLFFILPAIYVAIFGRNVAWWVYAIIAFMIVYGSYSAIKKVKVKMNEVEEKL